MHVALVIRRLMSHNFYIFLLVSQYPDILSKIANSFVETIIIE
jgi:hypothetical protein